MRLTFAEISERDVRHNIMMIKKFSESSSIVAMIKANAYGHDAKIYSKILRAEGIEYLGFAFIEEAIEIRQFGDCKKMMILVPAVENDADAYIDYSLETCFSSIDTLNAFGEAANNRKNIINGHLFIDTGMNRDGIKPEDAIDFMKKASEHKYINIVGICSHLSTADSDDYSFGLEQMELFRRTISDLEKSGFYFKYKHISNSAGLVNIPRYECNLVRPGISFHGVMSSEGLAAKMKLKPTLSLKSSVQLVKSINKGDTVGYSLKYIADKDTNIAVVPIGYGDGLMRNLTNKMQCLINGKRYNQIGSICMDECMFEIGNDNINPSDEVVIIGKQGNEEINIYELSNLLNTIPYEITTLITNRVPRILI